MESLFKSAFSRLSHKSTPLVETNPSIPLDSWCHQLPTHPTRSVQKVEICTALATGQDAWGSLVDSSHYHTLLRLSLVPTPDDSGPSGDVFLLERVLSTSGAFHSVIPISDPISSPDGTLFRPDAHDRICIASHPPARDLEVERTLAFDDDDDDDGSSGPHRGLTLAQLAQILEFVSRATLLICAGGDCQFQSRAFAFTCMAALTPDLPPPALGRNVLDRGVGMNCKNGMGVVDDSVFEASAEGFLSHVPWLVRREDDASMRALRLILSLKDEQARS